MALGSRPPSVWQCGPRSARPTQEIFSTPVYRVETTDDVIGLEVAAAMKNAYAIALGIGDGLEQSTGRAHHNLRAALFPRAVAEMVALAAMMGGRAETVTGLAGGGDLQVTITSGRNRLLGERIGLGEAPAEAIRALSASGTTVEGYSAARLGSPLASRAVTDIACGMEASHCSTRSGLSSFTTRHRPRRCRTPSDLL